MENLMKEIDSCLEKHNIPPISEVVNNRNKCIQYISRILDKYDNKVIIPFHHTLDKYDFRIKHVLFSFGLGFYISSFCNLKQEIDEVYSKKYMIDAPFTYIWLTLCLYHDFGYFIGPRFVRHETLESLKVDYDIFKANYCTSRYSKQLYYAYYDEKCSKQMWAENGYDLSLCEEVGDHGILGGYMLFQRLCASEEKPTPPQTKNPLILGIYEHDIKIPVNYHQERIPLYQDICFRIMEHNIWKRNEPAELGSPFCEIDSDHFEMISQQEPLLYLLCLVDTIEMTKKFCQYKDSSGEKDHFIFPKTLGSKVYVEVSGNSISINYRDLEKTIRQNKYLSGIESWTRSVTGLHDWVQVDVDHNKKDCVFTISASSLPAIEILLKAVAL